ncbi:hypothetical protein V5F63_07255 [Xanthobacter autotrophicus DSM 597]|uniref:hypothetical protein n=1 Tax=Xanthobacter wiegelii TaxID=3119913 RepID=UPI00372ADD3C
MQIMATAFPFLATRLVAGRPPAHLLLPRTLPALDVAGCPNSETNGIVGLA